MTALERAFKLLAKRRRTQAELLRALARAKVPEAEAQLAVARLRELGYMDDREVAAARARSLTERGDGPRKIVHRLRSQGIEAKEAKAAADGARGEESEVELAKAALRGRVPADLSERRKLLRQLIAKGHRPGVAARVLGIEWDGDEELAEE